MWNISAFQNDQVTLCPLSKFMLQINTYDCRISSRLYHWLRSTKIHYRALVMWKTIVSFNLPLLYLSSCLFGRMHVDIFHPNKCTYTTNCSSMQHTRLTAISVKSYLPTTRINEKVCQLKLEICIPMEDDSQVEFSRQIRMNVTITDDYQAAIISKSQWVVLAPHILCPCGGTRNKCTLGGVNTRAHFG